MDTLMPKFIDLSKAQRCQIYINQGGRSVKALRTRLFSNTSFWLSEGLEHVGHWPGAFITKCKEGTRVLTQEQAERAPHQVDVRYSRPRETQATVAIVGSTSVFQLGSDFLVLRDVSPHHITVSQMNNLWLLPSQMPWKADYSLQKNR